MPETITLPSYAKVNYTLDVLSLRAGGYHGIASVMQTVSLADAITLTRRAAPGVSLACDATGVPADATNLAWRAAEAALRAAGSGAGVHIRLEKRIPSQAGLGGGSSNAAYVLLGVNRLFDLGLDSPTLLHLAAELGSDVPFFLIGGTGVARGRGELLTPLPDGPPLWFVIVKPDADVSTAEAYRALDAIPDRASARATRRMEEALASGEPERVVARMSNDFEQVVFARHLPVALLHDDLLMARARNARLCGSGSAVFGVCYSEAGAREVARLIRLKYAEVHVCRALARSEAV